MHDSATDEKRTIKAVGLLSGGLDSILATRVMMEQGVEVTPIHIETGLTYERRKRLTGQGAGGSSRAERAAEMLGLHLVTIRAFEDYIPVILNPEHGYGSQMNPCVDCRIFLLRQAKAWMEDHDHQFVFTGEVLGQRPNSQMRESLKIVEQESGLEGLLLRPLSAKLLEPTVPERRSWVEREKLYRFHGRSRKPQMTLAKKLGITEYPQPAGGCCFLVDAAYSHRLEDFLRHEGPEALSTEQAFLLSVGRHLRLPKNRKVIVGRHKEENAYIATQRDQGLLMTTLDVAGPTSLVFGDPTKKELEQAARITARYAGVEGGSAVRVQVVDDGQTDVITVSPMGMEEIHALMV
jgi:tRNA U34 2-thiouridine synthase MnmA/TrmU